MNLCVLQHFLGIFLYEINSLTTGLSLLNHNFRDIFCYIKHRRIPSLYIYSRTISALLSESYLAVTANKTKERGEIRKGMMVDG